MSKGEATRQSILECATALASRVGLNGLTIGGLADELGLSKSGLFAHFKSKEALEVQVLEYAGGLFIDAVVKPALRAARGEPRIRALFERMIDWQKRCGMPGGCPILGAALELDDRPGPARDLLVGQQKDWLDTLANLSRAAVAEGHFGKRVAPEQIAFELFGIQAAYHHASRLLGDPDAGKRAKTAFEALIARAQA
jgi:AcrR family transcriptional regulator